MLFVNLTMDPVSIPAVLLIASLTVNVYFCQGHVLLMVRELFRWLKLRDRDKEENVNASKHLRIGNLICDLIVSQVLGWFALTILLTKILHRPFHSPDLDSRTIVQILFSIHIGRQAHKTFDRFFVKVNVADALCYGIQVTVFVAFLYPGNIAFLGLLAMATEIGDANFKVHKIMMAMDTHITNKWVLVNAHCKICSCIASRIALPTVMVSVACFISSPLNLDNRDIIIFFFYVTFSFALNFLLVLRAIFKLKHVQTLRKLSNLFSKIGNQGLDQDGQSKDTFQQLVWNPHDKSTWTVLVNSLVHRAKYFRPSRPILPS